MILGELDLFMDMGVDVYVDWRGLESLVLFCECFK